MLSAYRPNAGHILIWHTPTLGSLWRVANALKLTKLHIEFHKFIEGDTPELPQSGGGDPSRIHSHG